jgi:hypothetical protein
MWSIFVRQLRASETLVTALVVGALINLYGQVLVPLLRGSVDVLGSLARDFRAAPGVTLCSVALGFAFPWLVSAYAGARARAEIAAATSLARFPDLKPDPVFRATSDGVIIEAGAQTRELLRRYDLERAQDILGDKLWAHVVSATHADGILRAPEIVHFEPSDTCYVVSASAGPDGINVYLAVAPTGMNFATGRSVRAGKTA